MCLSIYCGSAACELKGLLCLNLRSALLSQRSRLGRARAPLAAPSGLGVGTLLALGTKAEAIDMFTTAPHIF